MDLKWHVKKKGSVHTDSAGQTTMVLVVTADNVTLLPEEGDRLNHIALSHHCPLSDRELDTLRCLAEGMVYKQIATEMCVSISTVRTHLHNIYGKIDVSDRAQAVLMAWGNGWI